MEGSVKNTLKHAYEYYQRGLSILALEPISKKPLVNSWEPFQKVIADEGRKTLAYRSR